MSEVFTTDGKFFEGYCLSCHTLNPKVECGGCQKQQIADLEAQLAERDKVVEVLAEWASKYIGEGDEFVAIEKATEKAKEQG